MTVAIAVVFGLARVLMAFDPPSELVMNLFKDAAHIFVGYVFTRWWFDRVVDPYEGWHEGGPLAAHKGRKRYLLWTGILLSLLELVVGVTTAISR